MTIKELEKLGIAHVGSKIEPRLFFIQQIGKIKIPENYTIDDIFDLIYENGKECGIEIGKRLKIEEIRKCLGIIDIKNDNY